MFRFLRDRLPSPVPEIVMAVWYVVLLLLVLLCAEFPQQPFRYLGI